MTTQFFIPTRQDILAIQVGGIAPNVFGELAKVTEITAKGPDISGKWFCCYYVEFGNDGSKISHSLKEDELDRSLPLCNKYNSYELDDIEKRILEGYEI